MQGYLYGELNRTQMIIDGDNLLNNIYELEGWGLSRLKKINTISDNSTEELKSQTPERELEINSSNQYKYANIQNQNSLFNINYLYNLLKCSNKESGSSQKVLEKIFINIANNADVDMSNDEISLIVSNIQKWMCTKPLLQSEQLTNYSGNPIDSAWSYQTSGQLFVDISELRLIPGVTDQFYSNMQDKITIFPVELKNNNVQVKFNIDNPDINTLAALAGVDKVTASSYWNTIKNLDAKLQLEKIKQFISEQKIYDEQEIKEINNMLFADDKGDYYYKIISKARIGKYEIHMQTLVNTDSKNNTLILWRKRGIIYG